MAEFGILYVETPVFNLIPVEFYQIGVSAMIHTHIIFKTVANELLHCC